jgi:hypothetical protein
LRAHGDREAGHRRAHDRARLRRRLAALVTATAAMTAEVRAEPPGDGGPATGDDGRAAGDLEDLEDLDDLDALDELDGETWTLKGAFSSQARVYLADRGRAGHHQSWVQEARLELDVRWSEAISASLRPWLLVDAVDPELRRYEPLEAYVDLAGQKWDLRAGQFLESWGIADTSNPLDILNRTDPAVDPLAPPRRGELGARLRFHGRGGQTLGQPTFALYAIPLFRELDFPTGESRVNFAPPGATLAPDEATRPELDEALFSAARLDFTLSTRWLRADVQAIAARGPTRFPTLVAAPQPDGSLHVVPEYFGAYTVGGGFRAVPNTPGHAWLSELTLKAEVVYTRPHAFAAMTGPVPDDYLQLAAGFARTVPLADAQELSVIVELLAEVGADDPLSQLRLFDRDVAARLAWAWNDPALTSLEVRAIVDVRDGTVLGNAVLRRQLLALHDDLQLELGAQYVRLGDHSRGALTINPSNLTTRLSFAF